MYPEIFHISWLHTYGVLVALAFLAGLGVAAHLGKRTAMDVDALTNLGIYCALAAIVGAKVMMFLVDSHYRENPREIFRFDTLQAGGVFYGGLIGALLVAWWYMRKTKLPLWKTADVFAPGIALGHGIGRIGCFTAGCCWGVACKAPWAVTFRDPVANYQVGVPLGVPLHPTQLYEAFAEFAIFGILYYWFGKPHKNGAIIALYLVLYGFTRFVVEFFRFHEQGNLFNGPLDTSQWISIVLCGLGVAYLVGGRKTLLATDEHR